MKRTSACLLLSLPAMILFQSCSESPDRDRIPFSAERDGTEKWGFRNREGEIVIPPVYAVVEPFTRFGVAAVADDSGWVLLDISGRPLLRPFIFDNGPDPFSEDMARFVWNGRIGFFDRSGRIVIPAEYDFALPFSEAMAAVCIGCREEADGEYRTVRGGSWGFIDPKGRRAIPLRYEAAESFHGGKAVVVLKGEKRMVDASGRESGG
jgi:hypothetical protein